MEDPVEAARARHSNIEGVPPVIIKVEGKHYAVRIDEVRSSDVNALRLQSGGMTWRDALGGVLNGRNSDYDHLAGFMWMALRQRQEHKTFAEVADALLWGADFDIVSNDPTARAELKDDEEGEANPEG